MAQSDADLITLIDRELKASIGADDLSASDRARAMEFYLGEAKGDLLPPEVDGRSKVVSKDLMDTVEWMMPSLMGMFASADDIIRFEPESREDEKGCQDATSYVGYLIHRKNEGFTVIHDAIKSALIQRVGVIKVFPNKAFDMRRERYRGVTQAQVEDLQADSDAEIVEQVEAEPILDLATGAVVPLFDIVLRQRIERLEFKTEGVPPEEIRIAKDTRLIADTRFIAHQRLVSLSDLRSMGYDKAKIAELSSDDKLTSAERDARHDYDDSDGGEDAADGSQRKVTLVEAYAKIDEDKDGVSEFRRIVKAGSVIFENEVTDDHPFALFCPILMPYKVIGLSMFDLIEDIQRIKTALTRQVLDNVYLSNNPITEYVDGQVNIDDLLNPSPGGTRRVKQVGMTREVSIPFVAGAGLQLIEFADQVRDTRTGVTEMNSALNAESLAKGNVGSEGVQALMQAGAQRIELVARVFAETGFKRLYYLMLKLVTQYQDKPAQARINGRWLEIDPREWKNRYDMTVSVGIGNAGRQQQIANLGLLGQAQEKVMPLGLAGPQQIYQTATRLAEAMGYKDSDQFFTAPQEGQPQPQGEQDPMDAQAQAIVSAEQIKAQATLQKAQMDNEVRLIVEREKIASQERVAMFEAQEKIKLEQERLQAGIVRESMKQPPAWPTPPYSGATA